MNFKAFLILILFSNNAFSQAWNKLGNGFPIFAKGIAITELAFNSHHDLFAAGSLKDSALQEFVGKWDGNTWSEVGANTLNINDQINTMAIDESDNIYIGGWFSDATYTYHNVKKWDGISWSQLGSGGNALNANSFIASVYVEKQNELYAGGAFTNSSGHQYVAKWDGISWQEVGTGINSLNANGYIQVILGVRNENKNRSAGSTIYAAGGFTNASGKSYVAKWNGISWEEVGTGANALNANASIIKLVSDKDGNLYAGGLFTDSANYYYVAKWDGTSWTMLGGSINAFKSTSPWAALEVDEYKNIYVSGGTWQSGFPFDYGVFKWDGFQLSELGGGHSLAANDNIYVIKDDKQGCIYTSGRYTDIPYNIVVSSFCGPTAINDIKKPVSDLMIYPNPASDILYLNNTSATPISELSLFDAEGRLQCKKNSGILTQLNIQSLAKGIYMLRIKRNEEISFLRFVKD